MSAKIEPQQRITQDDQLEQLKQLLFEKELSSVEELRKHLLDPQQRIADTSEILADSIKLAATEKQGLVEALNNPVDECIRSIVTQKPQQFADSLFPVMGPAIRKSISETLKSFVQSTNQMIEQSMSPQSLRWRWEAKRSGVPFSEIVLKHSLLYRVEEVFLIQQGTGLLIEHVSHPDVLVNDSDAISAMLTVIRDFSRDSFSAAKNDSLQTVEFGERTLWIVDGPKALIACVNRGLVPKKNRTLLQSVLEQFHSLYGPEIDQFSGARGQYPQFHDLLETCLTQQSKKSESKTEKNSDTSADKLRWLRNPFFWIVVILALLASYWFWSEYDLQRRTDALYAELKSTPGVVVIGAEKSGDALLIKVLRDPLAPALDLLAEKYGFTHDELQFQTGFYQSLDPPMALKRAIHFLDVPETVKLTAKNQQLLVSGTAPRQWLDFAIKMRDRVPGFSAVNFEQLKVDDSLRLLKIRQQLQAPQTVNLHLDNNKVLVTGNAPAAWIKGLKQKQTLLYPELSLITQEGTNKLEAEEWSQAIALQQQLEGVSFYFSRGAVFNDKQRNIVSAELNKISRLFALMNELKADLKFVVKGYADGIGSVALNQALKLKRAETIKQQLIGLGINSKDITTVAGQSADEAKQADISLRRADLQVKLLRLDK